MMTRIQMTKGWLFILTSAAIIFFLLQRDIKKYSRTQSALLENEKKFKAILNHRFQLTGLLDIQGRLLMINDVARNMAGVDAEELIGKYFWQMPHWSHSLDLQKEIENLVQSARQGNVISKETTHIDYKGNIRYIDFSLTPVHDDSGDVIYIVPEGKDVTEKKKSENKLIEKERNYREIYNSSSDAILIHDAETGKIVDVNQTMLDMYEVTQGQWKTLMNNNPSKFKSGDDFPVENVSRNDALLFINTLNQKTNLKFGLPTEAQWEFAARSGGKDESFAGGDITPKLAWYSGNSADRTHRVGTKSPNGLGIYDMSGNVNEWCEDVYNKHAYAKHSNRNPVSVSGSPNYVYRGGSWGDYPDNVRSSYRTFNTPDYAIGFLGFRLSLYPEKMQQTASKNPSPLVRDGNYVKFPNNIVYDSSTSLEWFVGPDKNTTWKEAKSWIQELKVDSGGWRLPSVAELQHLYKQDQGFRNMTPLLETNGWWVWSEKTDGVSSAWGFGFYGGTTGKLSMNGAMDRRAFAVRNGKQPDKMMSTSSSDLDALLAAAKSEKLQQENKNREAKQRLDEEKNRLYDLVKLISKYDQLIHNYGDQYKVKAWQAIRNDFPLLTKGMETGEINHLKTIIGITEDGFFLFENGIALDTKNHLEWVKGTDEDVNWSQANEWISELNQEDGGWRIPTLAELESLYHRAKLSKRMKPFLSTTGKTVWSADKRALFWNYGTTGQDFYYQFDFKYGFKSHDSASSTSDNRVIAVRVVN